VGDCSGEEGLAKCRVGSTSELFRRDRKERAGRMGDGGESWLEDCAKCENERETASQFCNRFRWRKCTARDMFILVMQMSIDKLSVRRRKTSSSEECKIEIVMPTEMM